MLNRLKTSRLLAIALLALTHVGCTEILGPEQDELALARARWAVANADDYSFQFRRSCFCPTGLVRPVHIEVLDGTVTSAVYVDTEEPLPPPLTSVPTIDDLFDEVQAAIDGMAFSILADYDADLGYPISVSIDHIKNAIDDEMVLTVSSFRLGGP